MHLSIFNVHQKESCNREHMSLYIFFINTSFHIEIPNTLGLT